MRWADARAWATLARWPNALLAALGVLVGAWWAGVNPAVPRVLAAALAAVALAVVAYAWNDAADLAIDRIAHPERPLPAGRLGVAQARAAAHVAAALALVASAAARPWLALLTAAVLALMYAYAPLLKARGLAGNVTVAVLASLPFVYGAAAAGRARAGLLLAAVAAPLHLARELAKDLDDAAADALARRTLPHRIGRGGVRVVIAAAVLLFLLLAAALLAPAARSGTGAWLLLPAAVAAAATAAALRGMRGAPLLFKAAMLGALGAVVAARP